MHPPADPWGQHEHTTHELPQSGLPPSQRQVMYGRAAVPAPAPALTDTAELVLPASTPPASRPVSWQRTSRASLRSLSDGWGLTAAGAMVAFAGWGVWAAALRGTGTSLFTGVIVMIVVAAGLFVLARFLGYLLVQRVLRRRRPHARWAHFLTGAFLTAAGVSYFVNTSLLASAGDWLGDTIEWIGQLWPRG